MTVVLTERQMQAFHSRLRSVSTGCIEWTGGRDQNGYGIYSHWDRDAGTTRTTRAHRLAWQLAHDVILDRTELVCHRCDNPSCCNVDHLFIGSHADNHADRGVKGRTARGQASGKAKLTESDVLLIRQRLADGVYPSHIATEIGCSTSTVQHVQYGRTWRWL